MSSAILYVAIVAIWACVLIPRWLRRDSSGSASAAPAEAEEQATVAPTAEEEPAPAPAPARRRRRSVVADRERRSAPHDDPAPADPAHRRVLSARRRLLLMLAGLSIAAGALAGAKLAAWWVVLPPSVMVFSYLFLLRAASQVDAQRRDLARYQMARAAAEAASTPARRSAPVAPAAPAVRVAPAARVAEAAEAKVITIPPAPEEIYDQYADAKLRAVGD